MTHSVSVVVPVYNSEASLEALVDRLVSTLRERIPFEIILVNDGSADGSWEKILALAERFSEVRGFSLLRNFGQHNALLCGIFEAQHDAIVTLDDDLQNPPEEIWKLLEQLDKGYDLVYATSRQQTHTRQRSLAAAFTKLVLKHVMGAETARLVSPYRAFRASVRPAFREYKSPTVNIDVLLTWGATDFSSVEVRHDQRTHGSSHYTFTKLVRHSLDMVTGFSTLPLRLASWIGFLFTLFGMAVLAYTLLTYAIYRGAVPGFAFLACTIAIFSGAQLFALGMIGEYLARIHWRVMDRPAFVVSETTDLHA